MLALVTIRTSALGVALFALSCGPLPKISSGAANVAPLQAVTTPSPKDALNPGSVHVVRSLGEPIQVDAFVFRGAPYLDRFVQSLTCLLDAYQHESNGKFRYRLLDTSIAEVKEQANAAGLQPANLVESDADDSAAIAKGYSGLVFKYKSETAIIPHLNPAYENDLESWITRQMAELRDTAEGVRRRIGVITGKDELKLSDRNLIPRRWSQSSPSIQQILTQAFPFYTFEDVDLRDGGQAVGSDLAGLVVTQPRRDYSDSELRRIDEFLMKGNKSLAVFASAVTLEPQDTRMQARLSTHHLEKLLSGYGVKMRRNALLDFRAHFEIAVLASPGQAAKIAHPGIVRGVGGSRDKDAASLDDRFGGFFLMEELTFPYPSSLELLRDRQPAGIELKVVARTSSETVALEAEPVDMRLKTDWTPTAPVAQHVIAVAVSGKLRSAFAGQKNAAIAVPEFAPRPSRVLVVSSSQFLTNPFAFAGNGPLLDDAKQSGESFGDPTLQAVANPYAKRYLTNTILAVSLAV